MSICVLYHKATQVDLEYAPLHVTRDEKSERTQERDTINAGNVGYNQGMNSNSMTFV